MNLNFSPIALMTENEKAVLLQFSDALREACDSVPACSLCPLRSLCKEANVPEFFNAILVQLAID